MKVEVVRIANAVALRNQFYPDYGGLSAFAKRVGLSRQYVNNIMGPKATLNKAPPGSIQYSQASRWWP